MEHECQTPAAFQGGGGQRWVCPDCQAVWVARGHIDIPGAGKGFNTWQKIEEEGSE